MTQAAEFPAPCPWTAAAQLIGDGAALRHIVELAGPDLAPRILSQMQTDLAATSEALAAAVSRGDCTEIRAQSHVLISLVGTIGAKAMHSAACRLNEAAHAGDHATIAGLTAGLARDTVTLVAALGRIGAAA